MTLEQAERFYKTLAKIIAEKEGISIKVSVREADTEEKKNNEKRTA